MHLAYTFLIMAAIGIVGLLFAEWYYRKEDKMKSA